jgi:hypothetical protein
LNWIDRRIEAETGVRRMETGHQASLSNRFSRNRAPSRHLLLLPSSADSFIVLLDQVGLWFAKTRRHRPRYP